MKKIYKTVVMIGLALSLFSCGKKEPSVSQGFLNGTWSTGCVLDTYNYTITVSGDSMDVNLAFFTGTGCSTLSVRFIYNGTFSIAGPSKTVANGTNFDYVISKDSTCIGSVCTANDSSIGKSLLSVFKFQDDAGKINLYLMFGAMLTSPTEADRVTSVSTIPYIKATD